MNRKKIVNFLSAAFYLLMAIWLLDFDNPDKLFASLICVLAFIGTVLRLSNSDYCIRASRRLARVVSVLTLVFLIKILFSL